MADNMIELVASLNVDDSANQINKTDIPLLKDKIKAIKIKCELDTDDISSIQTQLSNIRAAVPQIDLGVGIDSGDIQQRVVQTVSVIQQNLDRNVATANVNFNFNQSEIERFTSALTSLRVQGVDMEQLQQRLQNLGITIEKITPSFTQAARDGEKFLSTLSIKGVDSAGNLVTYIENFDRRTHNFQNATLKVEESFAKIRKAEEAVKSETEAVQKVMNDFLKLQGRFDLYNKRFGSEQSLQSQFSELQNLIDSFDNTAPLENQRESLIRIDNALRLIKVDIDNLGEVSTQVNAQTIENSERIIDGLKEQYRASEDVKNITTDWTKNADNDLIGFVLNVQKATGEVERFRYAFDESGNAELLGSLGTDRGTTQALEKATKAANTLERQMINLKAAADDASAPRPITSEEGINKVVQAYKNAETAIGNLRTANASTFEELNNEAKKAVDELNNVIKAQRNADTAATKLRAKPIEVVKADELSNLDKFVATISNSAIPDVANLTQRVEELRSELSEVNDKQGLVDYLNKFANVESDFKALVAQAKAVKGALRNLDNLSNDALFQKNKSNSEVISTLSDIEGVRKEYSKLFTEIGNAKTPEDLQKISNRLTELKPRFDKVTNSANQFKTALKSESIDAGLENRIKRLTADINSYAVANKRAVESTKQMSSGRSFADEWSRITSVMAKGADLTDRELKDLSADMAVFRKEAQSAGITGVSALDSFLDTFKKVSTYISAQAVYGFAKQQISSMIQEVISLDSAMVNLRKVTNESDESYQEFIKSAQQQGKVLHATTSDVVEQSAEWAKLGYNLDEARKLSKVSTIYSKVGELDNQSAVQDLVATMKAFNVEASDGISIVDRLNKLGNEFATESRSLGEGLRVSASALSAAGNDLDETLALITGGTEIVQDANQMGTALRTISMRIRGKKVCLRIRKLIRSLTKER